MEDCYAFDVIINEKGYAVIKEKKVLIPERQMESTLEFLKDYDLLIKKTERSWYDNSDDERASCSDNTYDTPVCCDVDFKKNFRFLAFSNGLLFGIVFIIQKESHGIYGGWNVSENDSGNTKVLFSFDGTPTNGYFSTGWHASHSGRSLRVHSVKLVKKGSEETQNMAKRHLSKFFLSFLADSLF